jgi:uncharacterized protein (DUF1919 family)
MRSDTKATSSSSLLQRVQRHVRKQSWTAYELIYLAWVRWRLRHKSFSIITNNCWGAQIYQKLRRIYTTPFVGLFIPPSCYLTMLRDFNHYLQAALTFVKESRRDAVNRFREGRGLGYPIGNLGGEV